MLSVQHQVNTAMFEQKQIPCPKPRMSRTYGTGNMPK